MSRLLNTGLVALPLLASTLFGAMPVSASCPTKGKPSGKVLLGYWENWDGAANGVHPGFGWTNISDPVIAKHGYNVLHAAFPVMLEDGTVLWEDGMKEGVKVGSPDDYCAAKEAGATILLSTGSSFDLSSQATADKFISTIVPILTEFSFDGINIDVEADLLNSGDFSSLSESQTYLIYIIDGILAKMPDNFGLTMAPKAAYATGGSRAFSSIWGSYLPLIKKYIDNDRLWWLNMQYYDDDMYDCEGNVYDAGTVAGFVAQTDCLNAGLNIQNTTVTVPYDKQVPGLAAQDGAGRGYMTPDLVGQVWDGYKGQLKGLMTWSVNWDGSQNWTFADNLQGRIW